MKVLQICFQLMDPYVCEHKFRWCKRGGSILIYIQDQDSYTLKNNLIVFQTDLESIFMAQTVQIRGMIITTERSTD